MHPGRITCFGFLVLFALAPIVADASSPSSKLGTINFPTSGSGEAQQHFLRGVAALHSFWYPEALEAFRKSTQADPGFAMGYWGEAMAHNHHMWAEQDAEAGKEVLARVPAAAKMTPREKAYLDAVKLLYGKGDKRTRDEAYLKAMEKIYRDYPDDLEAACFYALSLLGAARNYTHKLHDQVRAGAIGLEVFRHSPDHPCAAHYTIHAFDHPDLAVLALPAARRYAQIAPASHHAQHMPAHIFVQLGMWPEAEASNQAGWDHSGHRDYHSLQWLHYVYLQQGRYQKADEIFQLKLKDMADLSGDSKAKKSGTRRKVGKYYERMAGASVIENERWESASALNEPPGWNPKSFNRAGLLFVKGFAAAMRGAPEADRYLAELDGIRQQGFKRNYFQRPEQLDIWSLEITAVKLLSGKNYEEAAALMKQATDIEAKLPDPSGPPRIIKPTYEFLGEILLRAGQPKEAAQQFGISLSRHPNRARSLLGAARAAAAGGDKEAAAERYKNFLKIWEQADPALPELREAKNYLKSQNAR